MMCCQMNCEILDELRRELAAANARMAKLEKENQQQIYADLNNSNPEWKKIYPDYSKFLADQNAWFRFTEGTFDRFMQQQKL